MAPWVGDFFSSPFSSLFSHLVAFLSLLASLTSTSMAMGHRGTSTRIMAMIHKIIYVLDKLGYYIFDECLHVIIFESLYVLRAFITKKLTF
ncbi:hypothetical protein YC2023_099753 [Brassica napus]